MNLDERMEQIESIGIMADLSEFMYHVITFYKEEN